MSKLHTTIYSVLVLISTGFAYPVQSQNTLHKVCSNSVDYSRCREFTDYWGSQPKSVIWEHSAEFYRELIYHGDRDAYIDNICSNHQALRDRFLENSSEKELQRKWIKFFGDAVITQTSDIKKMKASIMGSLLAMSDICPGFQLLIEDELPYLVDQYFSGT